MLIAAKLAVIAAERGDTEEQAGSGELSRATRPPDLSAGGRTPARSTKPSFCARMDRHLPGPERRASYCQSPKQPASNRRLLRGHSRTLAQSVVATPWSGAVSRSV